MSSKAKRQPTVGRIVIRTINVNQSFLERSLEEVLADPTPFPRLEKVAEGQHTENNPETKAQEETGIASPATAL